MPQYSSIFSQAPVSNFATVSMIIDMYLLELELELECTLLTRRTEPPALQLLEGLVPAQGDRLARTPRPLFRVHLGPGVDISVLLVP